MNNKRVINKMSKKTIMTDIIASLLLVALFFGLPFILFSVASNIVTRFAINKQQDAVDIIYSYIYKLWTSDSIKNNEDLILLLQSDENITELNQRVRLISMDKTCSFDNYNPSYHQKDYYDKYSFDDSDAIEECRMEHKIYYETKEISSASLMHYYAIPLMDVRDNHPIQLLPYYILFVSFSINTLSLSKYSGGLIFITIILVLLAIVLAIILKHKIVIPIKLLSQETKLAADENGKFTKTVLYGNERKDEIGALSQSFTSVIEKVNYRISEIESLSSDLSHEIKNPLAVISNMAEILETGDFTEEERIEFSKSIINEAKKINSIVSKIREASKIENKIYEADKEKISLDNFIISYTSCFSEQHNDIKIIHNLNLNNKEILVSPDLLELMLSNLLTNAASFANTISVTTTINNNTVVMEIEDNGPGIPDEEKEIIFSRFYSKRKSKDNISHDGLGLYLVKYVVNSLNGDINVYDGEKLGGANFVIIIPFN